MGHYINWRKSRFDGIKKYIDLNFFINKTLFEVGCGYGDNGIIFQDIGCKVTASDARAEHIDNAKIKNPTLKYEIFDCDKDLLKKKYDIILHWGVLYHLDNIEKHLENMCENCDYLLLETEICDCEALYIIKTNENGYDQSHNNVGTRTSQKYVENILTNCNFNFTMINDKILNSDFHIYDWCVENKLTWKHGLRRFWICWNKNVKSPIK